MNTAHSSVLRFIGDVTLIVLMAVLGSSAIAAEGKLHALVIGNSDYGSGKLRNPANDATAMSNVLRSLGFQVSQLTNAGHRETEDAILRFSRAIQDDGLAFFFFAGHGVQVKGENYLIPIDAKIREEFEVRYQCISLSLILDALQNSGSNMNVVVLDSCRDNPFQRSWSRGIQSGLAATSDIPEGTLIAYATSPGATAADGQGKNSPYTLELVKSLSKRPETGLLLREAFFEASRSVKDKTGQSPWINMEASLSKFYLTMPGQSQLSKTGSPSPLAVAGHSVQPDNSPPNIPEPIILPESLPTAGGESSLEKQAGIFLRNGDYANAIEAFTAIIQDSNLGVDAHHRARRMRGSVYLSRGRESDIDRAIIDHKAAGLAGIRVPVRVNSSQLRVGNEIKGSVHRNQILLVTLSQGNWLWVRSINNDESVKGYVLKTAVLEPKTVTPSSSATAASPGLAQSAKPMNLYNPAVGQPNSSYPQGTYRPQGSIYSSQSRYQPQTSNRSQQRTIGQGQSQTQNSNQSRGSRTRLFGGERKTFMESFNQGYNRANSILRGGRR